MSKQIEAIKLALEVLKNCRENLFLKDYVEHIDLTITAMREALAEQPVQIESLADIGAAYEGIYAEQKAELAKALAEQPAQQEPVAMRDAIVVNLVREGINKHRARELADHFIGLATPQAQPAREPLTDEQILEIKAQFVWTLDFQFGEFARAIEAAHGITKVNT